MLPIKLAYNNTDAELLPFVESLSLSDVLSGEASTLSVVLNNLDGRFSGGWAAVKGDSLGFSLGRAPLRNLTIDKITIVAQPSTVTWSCSAKPITTRRPSGGGSGSKPPPPSAGELTTRASWSTRYDLTLSALLKLVAAEAGMASKYAHSADPDLGVVARNNETSWALLTRQAARFGCTVNASADVLTIIGPKRNPSGGAPEQSQSEIEINYSDIERAENSDTVAPAKVRTVKVNPSSAVPEIQDFGDGDGEEILVNSVGGDPEAILALKAAQSKELRITILPREIVAGALVKTPLGSFEVKKVDYSLTPSAESMTLTCKGR